MFQSYTKLIIFILFVVKFLYNILLLQLERLLIKSHNKTLLALKNKIITLYKIEKYRERINEIISNVLIDN